MNRKFSLRMLIETFTAFSGITLLAVIAEREEPGGDQHLISIGSAAVLLLIYAACTCIEERCVRPRPPKDTDNQDRKETSHES